MGMSIDDAIKRINNIMFTKFTTVKDEDAFLTAIETMRKYQKIDWITEAWDDDENAMILVHKIREVIEDGQNIIKD